ncbi:Ig-like domain-containing protein [Pseudooctadecabacter jejudonensis]|nr:Ig-like domain-containing protein [Pseudooctadecabacter jejudonensis]
MGITFRATEDVTGDVYDYKIAYIGATNTNLENTRTLVVPPAPVVSSVGAISPATYGVGTTISIPVTFSTDIAVTGTPQMSITVGGAPRVAQFASVQSGNTAVFTYTVQANDAGTVALGNIVNAGGSSIVDASSGAPVVDFTLNSVASSPGVLVDGVAPEISSITPPSMGTRGINAALDITLNFSEAVTPFGPGQLVASGTIDLRVGTALREATYLSGAGTTAITYRYTVQSGDEDTDGIALEGTSGSTFRDVAVNARTSTSAISAVFSGVNVDGVAPMITGFTVQEGLFKLNDTIEIFVEVDETITDGGFPTSARPTLTLDIGGTTTTASYNRFTGPSTRLRFSATVPSGVVDANGIEITAIDLDGAFPQDAVSNVVALTLPAVTTFPKTTVDSVRPDLLTVERLDPTTVVTNADTLKWKATFSEPVTGLAAGAFTVTGASGANLAYEQTANPAVWTVTASGAAVASAQGTLILQTALGFAPTDLAGNKADTLFATFELYTLDNTGPFMTNVARQSPSQATTNADSLTFRATFDDALVGVQASDFFVFVNNLPVSASSISMVSSTVYDVTFTDAALKDASGDIRLSISATRGAADALGNLLSTGGPSTANSQAFTLDNRAPEPKSIARFSSGSGLTNADTIDFLVTFSEDLTNLTASNFVTTGGAGSVTSVVSYGGADIYVVTVGGADLVDHDGRIGLDLAAAPTARDVAGNFLRAATRFITKETYELQNTGPSLSDISRSTPEDQLTNANSVEFELSFSGDVDNPQISDFQVVGGAGAITAVRQSSGDVFVTVSGNGLNTHNGNVTVGVSPTNNLKDLLGNPFAQDGSIDTESYTFDNTAPRLLTIARQSPTQSTVSDGPVTFRMAFSEALASFDATDVVIFGGGTVDVAVAEVNSSTFDVTVSGANLDTLNGTLSASLNLTNLSDVAGNDMESVEPTSSNETYTFDNDAPILLSITRADPQDEATNATTLAFDAVFNEPLSPVFGASSFSSPEVPDATVVAAATSNPNRLRVTVSGGSLATYSGFVSISLSAPYLISDVTGDNFVFNTQPTGLNQSFLVDRGTPRVASIVRAIPEDAVTNADSLSFLVSTTEAVRNLSTSDFAVNGTAGTVTSVTPVSSRMEGSVPEAAIAPVTAPCATAHADVVCGGLPIGLPCSDIYGGPGLGPCGPVGPPTGGPFPPMAVPVLNSRFIVVVSGNGLDTFDGVVGLNVASTTGAVDAAGNLLATSEPETDETYTLDNTAPTVTSIAKLSPTNSFTNADTLTWQVTFSEDLKGVDATTFGINGGATGTAAVTPVSARVYNVTFSGGNLADFNGVATLRILANWTDLAGNGPTNVSATDLNESYTLDNTAPQALSISRLAPDNEVTNVDSLLFQVVFDSPMGEVTAADFAVTGGAGAVTGVRFGPLGLGKAETADQPTEAAFVSAFGYFVTVSGNGLADHNGVIGLTVSDTATAVDNSGNVVSNGAPATNQTYTMDNLGPLPSLSAPAGPYAGAFTLTVTFSEPVVGFEASDLVTDADVGTLNTSDNTTFTVEITPTADGDVTIALPAGAVTDALGNSSRAATSLEETADVTQPSVVITTPDLGGALTNAAFGILVTFSEDVTDFTAADITVQNGAASEFIAISGSVYGALITPDGAGEVSVSIAAGAATDAVGLLSTASNTVTVTNDVSPPTAVITVPDGPLGSEFDITITFSEAVDGLDISDIVIPGAVIGTPVTEDGGVTWTVPIAIRSSGSLDITLTNGAVTDLAGNGSSTSTTISVVIDADAPVVTMNAADDVVTQAFTLNIAASEAIEGLTLEDLTVTNGSVSNLAGSGASYTVQVDPVIGAVVRVELPAGAVADAAGNVTAAATVFEVQAGSPEVALAEREDEVIDVVQQEALRRLDNEMAANAGMMNSARGRFMSGEQVDVSQDVPFDVTGTAELSLQAFSTSGTFYGQRMLDSGMLRIAQGQFNIVADDTGSTNMQVSGRVTLEKDLSETSRLGYFYGGSLNVGDIDGTFEGSSSSAGLVAGVYGLTQLSATVFADAYGGVGYTWTDIEFADDVLALDGDYGAFSYYAGASVTGSYMMESGIEFRPNASLDYGRTELGLIGFQADAFGLSSSVEQEFGAVSILELSLTPEVLIPLETGGALNTLSIAPSLVCRYTDARVDSENCGGGLAVGLDGVSDDGLSRYGISLDVQRTGDTERRSAEVYYELEF